MFITATTVGYGETWVTTHAGRYEMNKLKSIDWWSFHHRKKIEQRYKSYRYTRMSVAHSVRSVIVLGSFQGLLTKCWTRYLTQRFLQVDCCRVWCCWIDSHRFPHWCIIHLLICVCWMNALVHGHGWFSVLNLLLFCNAYSFNGWSAKMDAGWGAAMYRPRGGHAD